MNQEDEYEVERSESLEAEEKDFCFSVEAAIEKVELVAEEWLTQM